MRFKINLASQPYENARRFFFQWALALLALFVVSGLLVFAAARAWRVSHTLTRSVDEENQRLEKLNSQEKTDLEILSKDQNRDVRERSQAINSVILRKAFSWTRIFSDLEKIMPTRLRLIAITPQLSQADQIEIRMLVSGDSREKAIELQQNMEKAPDFRDARMTSETSNPKGTGQDPITFEITAVYVPSAAAAISEAEKATSPAAETAKPKNATQAPEPAKGKTKPATPTSASPPPITIKSPAAGGKK